MKYEIEKIEKDEKLVKRNLDLVEEAVKDCKNNKISYFTFVTIVSAITNPEKPSQEAINWAITNVLNKEKDKNKEKLESLEKALSTWMRTISNDFMLADTMYAERSKDFIKGYREGCIHADSILGILCLGNGIDLRKDCKRLEKDKTNV